MTAVSARLPAIDALRGLALFGILVVNMAAFHSGSGGIAPTGSATDALIAWLFTGKFILIFSFLIFLTIELGQLLLPTRVPDQTDVYIGTTGALLGVLAVQLLTRPRRSGSS